MLPKSKKIDFVFVTPIFLLMLFSTLILTSLSSDLFPNYFVFLGLGIFVFIVFSRLDYSVLNAFSKILYILSIAFLILPLLIGQVTRGSVRWVPIGALTVQPSEIVRPFLLIFFSDYLINTKITTRRVFGAIVLAILPFVLILFQPSLGVSVMMLVGFLGVFLASQVNKKYYVFASVVLIMLMPLVWRILAPYQKNRIISFIDPTSSAKGAGYNSIQSVISVGSGRLLGRGIGEGVQTQLAFLPERQTDFIFASISEELGFVGSFLVILGLFVILWRLTCFLEFAESPAARGYVAGFTLMIFAQIMVHIGMNMGLFPITGLPLPLVSAGGSSLLSTLTGLGIASSTQKSNEIRSWI